MAENDFLPDGYQGLTGDEMSEVAGNILEHHDEALQEVADKTDVVLFFRPVNKKTAEYKKTGVKLSGSDKNIPVAAKGMNIKGKSASTGFIHADQSTNKIGEYLAENEGKLSPEEVTEKTAEIVKLQKKVDEQIESGGATVVTVNVDGKDLQVLADPGGRPFVADYDLLTIGRQEKIGLSSDSDGQMAGEFGITSRNDMSTIMNIGMAIERADRKAGYLTERTDNKTAKKLASGYATTMVAHGADDKRPEGTGEKILCSEQDPIEMYIPGENQKRVVTSNDDLIKSIVDLQASGYHIPVNPEWGLDIPVDTQQKVSNLKASEYQPSTQDNETASYLEKNNFIKMARWGYQKESLKKEVALIDDDAQRGLAEQILYTQDQVLSTRYADKDENAALAMEKDVESLERAYQEKYTDGRPSPVGREAANHLIMDYLEAKESGNEGDLAIAANRFIDNQHATRTFRKLRPEAEYNAVLSDALKDVPEVYKCDPLKAVEKDAGGKAVELVDFEREIRLQQFRGFESKGKTVRLEEKAGTLDPTLKQSMMLESQFKKKQQDKLM